MSDGVVIAGGGLAAQRAAETLRRLGYAGPVRMVCAEPQLPYDRPPLSKEVLSGKRAEASVRFRRGANRGSCHCSSDMRTSLNQSNETSRPRTHAMALQSPRCSWIGQDRYQRCAH
jgi:hypothetical protein